MIQTIDETARTGSARHQCCQSLGLWSTDQPVVLGSKKPKYTSSIRERLCLSHSLIIEMAAIGALHFIFSEETRRRWASWASLIVYEVCIEIDTFIDGGNASAINAEKGPETNCTHGVWSSSAASICTVNTMESLSRPFNTWPSNSSRKSFPLHPLHLDFFATMLPTPFPRKHACSTTEQHYLSTSPH